MNDTLDFGWEDEVLALADQWDVSSDDEANAILDDIEQWLPSKLMSFTWVLCVLGTRKDKDKYRRIRLEIMNNLCDREMEMEMSGEETPGPAEKLARKLMPLVGQTFPSGKDLGKEILRLAGPGEPGITFENGSTIEVIQGSPDKCQSLTEWPKQVTVGEYSFGRIDDYDDNWRWAIVKDYEHAQHYGRVYMTFGEGGEPDPELVSQILAMLGRLAGND